MNKCRKCGSTNLSVSVNRKNPNAHDLYCKECGAWQKFASKDEVRLYREEDMDVPSEVRRDYEALLVHTRVMVSSTDSKQVRQSYEMAERLLQSLHGYSERKSNNEY